MNERALWKTLVETWIQHREAELVLLRRLQAAWTDSPFDSVAVETTPGVTSETDLLTHAGAFDEVVPPKESGPSSGTDPAETRAEAGSPMVDDSQPEVVDRPPSEVGDHAEQVSEVPLLLLGQADIWVGFPWDRVERVALTEEVELPEESEYRFSLGAILQVDREEEPYSLVWTQDGGPATLSCARIGGIVTTAGAADRSIEIVIQPRTGGENPRPGLLTLEEFVAELGSARVPEAPFETSGMEAQPGEQEPDLLDEDSTSIGDGQPTSDRDVEDDRVRSLGDEPALIENERVGIEGEPSPVDARSAPSRMNGSRRSIPHALVAVHYLPARVAVVRLLRSAGWSVEEEAQPQNLPRRLDGQSPDVLFVEPTGPLSASTQQRLQDLIAGGARIVVLGSRLRPGQAAPDGVLGRAPRLHFPFTEEESRELLTYLRVPAGDARTTG